MGRPWYVHGEEVKAGWWVGEMVKWLEDRDEGRKKGARVCVEVVHGVVVQVQQGEEGEGEEVGEWQWWKVTRDVQERRVRSEKVTAEMWVSGEKKMWDGLRRIPAQYCRGSDM